MQLVYFSKLLQVRLIHTNILVNKWCRIIEYA